MERISERVADSFAEASHEDVRQYLDWLRLAMSEYSQNVRRQSIFAILLIAAFELVVESKGTQIAIGPFRIFHDSIVLQVIPALVAYLLFQMFSDSSFLNSLGETFTRTFNIWSPKGEDNDLDVMIYPALPLYWNVNYGIPAPSNETTPDRVVSFATAIFLYVLLIGVIAFQVQAYIILFPRHHLLLLALWVPSLLFTFFCSVMATIILIAVWE